MLVATNVTVHAQIVREAYPEILEKAKEVYDQRIAEMKALEKALGYKPNESDPAAP